MKIKSFCSNLFFLYNNIGNFHNSFNKNDFLPVLKYLFGAKLIKGKQIILAYLKDGIHKNSVVIRNSLEKSFFRLKIE